MRDDGIHPVGALRPFIYISALRKLRKKKGVFSKELKNDDILDVLDKRWKNWLKNHIGRFTTLSFIPFGLNDSVGSHIRLKDAQDAIEQLINDIIINTITQLGWNYSNNIEYYEQEETWTPIDITPTDLDERFN